MQENQKNKGRVLNSLSSVDFTEDKIIFRHLKMCSWRETARNGVYACKCGKLVTNQISIFNKHSFGVGVQNYDTEDYVKPRGYDLRRPQSFFELSNRQSLARKFGMDANERYLAKSHGTDLKGVYGQKVYNVDGNKVVHNFHFDELRKGMYRTLHANINEFFIFDSDHRDLNMDFYALGRDLCNFFPWFNNLHIHILKNLVIDRIYSNRYPPNCTFDQDDVIVHRKYFDQTTINDMWVLQVDRHNYPLILLFLKDVMKYCKDLIEIAKINQAFSVYKDFSMKELVGIDWKETPMFVSRILININYFLHDEQAIDSMDLLFQSIKQDKTKPDSLTFYNGGYVMNCDCPLNRFTPHVDMYVFLPFEHIDDD